MDDNEIKEMDVEIVKLSELVQSKQEENKKLETGKNNWFIHKDLKLWINFIKKAQLKEVLKQFWCSHVTENISKLTFHTWSNPVIICYL